MTRGKNSDDRYVSIAGRVPFELRRMFKAQIALDNLDVNTAIERLLQGYIDGQFNVSDGEQASLLEFVDRRKSIETQTPEFTNTRRLQTPDSTDAVTSKPSSPTSNEGTARGGIIKYATGTEIGRARQKLQLTQRQMAKRLGIGQSSLARYEKGKSDTPNEVLDKAKELQRQKTH